MPRAQPQSMPTPATVTLALECWNADHLDRLELLDRAAASLSRQSWPTREADVLVTARHDTPGLHELLDRYFPRYRVMEIRPWAYYDCKNAALDNARGRYVLLADSDAFYAPEWAASLLDGFSNDVTGVTGLTRYEGGFLSWVMSVCDGDMIRNGSGYTRGFYCHNLAVDRQALGDLRFDTRMGPTGAAAGEAMRDTMIERGLTTWFTPKARTFHADPGFLTQRLRLGCFLMRLRETNRGRGASLASVPLLGPFLVAGGSFVLALGRTWRLRGMLPGGTLALPLWWAGVALAKTVELVGACAYAWFPDWLGRRTGWYSVA